jgi:hypothetical protein
MYLVIVGFCSRLHRSEVSATVISRPICEMWNKDNHRCLHIHFYCFPKHVTRHVPLLKVSFKHTQIYQHCCCRKQFSFVKTRILRHFISTGFGSVASHEVKSSPASMSSTKKVPLFTLQFNHRPLYFWHKLDATAILRLHSVFVYESNSCNPRGPLSNMIGYTIRYRVSIPSRDRHSRLRY